MKLEFVIAAESANARNVSVQLLQDRALRVVLSSARVLQMYLSSDAAGLIPLNADADGMDISAGVSGKVLGSSVDSFAKAFVLLTDAAGKANVIITNPADEAETVYLNVVDPSSGKPATSAAIAFIDNP